METPPLKADRQAKIAQLSKLVGGRKKGRRLPSIRRMVAPLSVACLIVIAWLVHANRDVFQGYLTGKIEHISSGLIPRITMENVQYILKEQSGKNMISVSGVIKNEDKIIAKIKGIKITIFDEDTRVKSWDTQLEPGFILPEDSLSFSVDEQLEKKVDKIRVEVSII
jgi:hypothetical protein